MTAYNACLNDFENLAFWGKKRHFYKPKVYIFNFTNPKYTVLVKITECISIPNNHPEGCSSYLKIDLNVASFH